MSKIRIPHAKDDLLTINQKIICLFVCLTKYFKHFKYWCYCK